MGKWENRKMGIGKMGKWELGKWENGKIGIGKLGKGENGDWKNETMGMGEMNLFDQKVPFLTTFYLK